MTREERREALACSLELLAARIRADERIPLFSPAWPLTCHIPGDGSAGLLAPVAASLGLAGHVSTFEDEADGIAWGQVTGWVGEVPVRVTADCGPVLPDETGLAEAVR